MSVGYSLACCLAPTDSSQVCCLRHTIAEQGMLHLQLVGAAHGGLPACLQSLLFLLGCHAKLATSNCPTFC